MVVVGKGGGDTTKGFRTGGGNDDKDDPPSALASAAALSELEEEIPFGLGGIEAAATSGGYDELVFAVFARGSILVLVLVLIHLCLHG